MRYYCHSVYQEGLDMVYEYHSTGMYLDEWRVYYRNMVIIKVNKLGLRPLMATVLDGKIQSFVDRQGHTVDIADEYRGYQHAVQLFLYLGLTH